jgi:ketosteroid isomerase-like protein
MSSRGDAEENALVRMFRWWNEAYVADAFTAEAFLQFFTQDAVLTVNGDVRADDVHALAAHFQRIRAATDEAHIELPLQETFVSGVNIFGHYRCRAVAKGVDMTEEVMASVKTRNGRIASFDAISRTLD